MPLLISPLEQNFQTSRGEFQDLLNQVVGRGTSLTTEPRLTAEDLFGGQMQRIFDTTGASANATKRALSRAMIGQGGDVSGAGAGQLLNVDEQANRRIGDVGLQFSQLADEINRARQTRGESLLTTGLQGTQNLLSMDASRLENFIQRALMERQAKKQRTVDIIGSILDAGATVGAAGVACWVAEELYGKDSPKVTAVRSLLMRHEGKKTALGEFYEQYKQKGRRWAKDVAKDLPLRAQAARLFDELYKLSQME